MDIRAARSNFIAIAKLAVLGALATSVLCSQDFVHT